MTKELLEKWLKEVGEMQKKAFNNRDFNIESKSTSIDLVTTIDKKSEDMLKERILSAYPDHSILGEESGLTGDSRYVWTIDPLDGTTNFAQGIPMFAISVALDIDGETVLGGVYHPLLEQLFMAQRGSGTTLNNKPVTVSSKKELKNAVIATGFPYDRRSELYNNSKNMEKMIPLVRGIRRMGAAAYDLALVASGVLDGYWELNIKPWDARAGVLLIEEAGGEVDYLTHHRGISLVAGNRPVIDSIKRVLGDFNG